MPVALTLWSTWDGFYAPGECVQMRRRRRRSRRRPGIKQRVAIQSRLHTHTLEEGQLQYSTGMGNEDELPLFRSSNCYITQLPVRKRSIAYGQEKNLLL